MARAGGFGTSLNPFASNSGSSLGQYSIGDSIRDLEAYRAEIAWGNGTITDEVYRLTLVKLVGSATTGTTSALSAQNKLDDVTYRIGRSKADAKSPDALIAFDQQALAGMNTGNLRYRDVKSSLDSELAQRRSRDYGIITDNYNLGKTSTESLMAWVQKTVATLPADAPDKDNWASVQTSLTDRLVSEKDAKLYQDYQDRKMKPADFLAYLQGRRDAYAFSSPKYAEADRRLQDAQKNVKDAAQSIADQDFSTKYSNGQISDTQYLSYLSKRIDGMAADDPARPEWQQRLTQTAHSLAEDKLRADLTAAKTTPAQEAAAKSLIAFYQAYAAPLNPSSAEYRTTQANIKTLKGNVKDAAQSIADQTVSDKYSNGKISDADYLKYLNQRVAGMEPGDPAKAQWQQRATQATHSLAEDKLRTALSLANSASGQATAARNLIAFYKTYSATLNPGSAEYRAAQVSIHTLGGYTSGGSSSGGGGGGRSSGGGGGGGTKKVVAGGVVVGGPGVPKIINPTGSFDAAIALMTPNANAPKKVQTISVDNLRLNLQSATYAANDKVWLYSDPRYPGQTVTRQNPDGTTWTDAKGKTMQVPGSSYRATSDNERAGMQMATANYSYQLAGIAVEKGDFAGYWTSIWHANTALEAVRNTQATAIRRDVTNQLDALDKGITAATSVGDAASVVNLLTMQYGVIERAITDVGGNLDETQVKTLRDKQDKVLANPLFPDGETDINGEPVPGGRQMGGAVDVNSPHDAQGLIPGAAVIFPNWHFLLKTGTTGAADWNWQYDDAPINVDGTAKYVAVRAGALGRSVTGEVKVDTSPVNGVAMLVHTADGDMTVPWPQGAQHISYVEDGHTVNGYSIDGGKTWVKTTGGVLPTVELNMLVTKSTDANGNTLLIDGSDGTVLFTGVADLAGSGVKWTASSGFISTALDNGAISWFGQAAAAGGDTSLGVGAVGQDFRIVTADIGVNGTMSLNFAPLAPISDILNTQSLTGQPKGQKTSDLLNSPSLAGQPRELGGLPTNYAGSPLAPPVGGSLPSSYAGSPLSPSGLLPTNYAGSLMAGGLKAATVGGAFAAGQGASFSLAMAGGYNPQLVGIINVGATPLPVYRPPYVAVAPISMPQTKAPVKLAPISLPQTKAPAYIAPISLPQIKAPAPYVAPKLAPISMPQTKAPVAIAPISMPQTKAPAPLPPKLAPISLPQTKAPAYIAPISMPQVRAPAPYVAPRTPVAGRVIAK